MLAETVPQHQLLDPKFREGFAQLSAPTFDSWKYFPDATWIIGGVSKTTIIMDHVGGMLGVGPYADRQAEIKAQWLATLAEIAKCPTM